MAKYKYNYCVDDNGVLYVYAGRSNTLLFTIQDCEGMSDKQLKKLNR